MCSFEEEVEGIGVARDVVNVKGKISATPGSLRENKARRYVGDPFRGSPSTCFLARLAARPCGSPRTVTIPQYWSNETKQVRFD